MTCFLFVVSGRVRCLYAAGDTAAQGTSDAQLLCHGRCECQNNLESAVPLYRLHGCQIQQNDHLNRTKKFKCHKRQTNRDNSNWKKRIEDLLQWAGRLRDCRGVCVLNGERSPFLHVSVLCRPGDFSVCAEELVWYW